MADFVLGITFKVSFSFSWAITAVLVEVLIVAVRS